MLKIGFALVLAFFAGSPVAEAQAPACAQVFGLELDVQALQKLKVEQTQARVKAAETLHLKLGPGKSLFVQYVKPASKDMPTLLLMPGVNRSLLMHEQGAMMLAHQGFGVASFNFSTQPLSVATLKPGERPDFRMHDPTLEDFARETESVARFLERDAKLGRLVPVSLSYTGMVSPYLKGFDLVIETVPMTSMAATNPKLEKYRQTLKAAEFFNPVFGPGITRASLDVAYRQQWTKQVDAISKQFNLPEDRRFDMIDGYTSMSRASEGADWKTLTSVPEGRRVFFLAGNEAPGLLRHQIETFRGLSGQREDALLFLVLESGHVLPSEQPAAYATSLNLLLSGRITMQSGVVVVEPSTGSYKGLTGKDARDFLDQLLEQLPKDSDASPGLTDL